MEYTEYGVEQNNIIIFLHGGGLAPWNSREEVKQLKDKYQLLNNHLSFLCKDREETFRNNYYNKGKFVFTKHNMCG